MGTAVSDAPSRPAAPAAAANPALAAYERFAPFYDEFVGAYAYDRWLRRLERLVRESGLRGSRLLDVACGTGRSCEPLARRGWEVTACDLSPAMVQKAKARLGAKARVFVADMRALPEVGPFDLVTCLDDSVNYLLSDEDLSAAFSSMARVLRPGGMVVFDCNSLHTYATTFASSFVRECRGARFCWQGQADPVPRPKAMASAMIEIFSPERPGSWRRVEVSRHLQRHHPRGTIAQALRRAGLALLAVRGQYPGARLVPDVDEEECPKLVYLAHKPEE